MRKYIATTILLSTALNGCSLFVMRPPSPLPTYPSSSGLVSENCNDDNAAPVGDAVLTTLLGAGAVVVGGFAINQSANTYGPTVSPQETGFYSLTGGLFGLALWAGWSSIYGFHAVNQCSVNKEHNEQVRQEQSREAKELTRQRQEEKEQDDEIEAQRLHNEKLKYEAEQVAQQKQAALINKCIVDKTKSNEIECANAKTLAAESARKLAAVNAIETWMSANCTSHPVYKEIEKIDIHTGNIVKGNVQVGSTFVCSTRNRPNKLDGRPLTNIDISNKTYAASSADRESWIQNVEDAKTKCGDRSEATKTKCERP